MGILDEQGLRTLLSGLARRLVRRVAGRGPDEGGNVPLTWEDVDALPGDWRPGWEQVANRPQVHPGTGEASVCLGEDNAAAGRASVAAGRGLVTGSPGELAAGTYNAPAEGAALCLGNGEDGEHRSNCAVVYKSGEAWFAGGVRTGPEAETLATRRELEQALSSLVDGDEEEY
jgi:hypothetical protein